MPRKPGTVEIPSLGMLDRAAGHLGRQLAQALRDAVNRGDLKPGEVLPSTRALAASLRVARGTVIEAFEQLIAEGFLQSQPGADTRVAPSLTSPAPAQAREASVETGPIPERAQLFTRVARQFTEAPQAPFAISVPVGPAAPDDAWRRIGVGGRSGIQGHYRDPRKFWPP